MDYHYIHLMAFIYVFFGIIIGIVFSSMVPFLIPIPSDLRFFFTVTSISAGILLGVLNFILFFAFVRRCIRHFQQVLNAVKKGDLTARASFQSKGIIGQMNRDFNETITSLERMKNETHTDDLTALPNRVAFQHYFQQESLLSSYYYTLYFLDIDQFKTINDTYGHVAGDQALILVAQALRAITPSTYTSYRLSGDEFVVLGPGSLSETATINWLENLHVYLNNSFIADQYISISVSVGNYVFAPQKEDLLDALAHADEAMYQAKRKKRRVPVL